MSKVSRALPLSPTVFHILLALADTPKHGYAIMKEIQDRTEGGIRLGPGTLYGSLDRLLAAKLIEECAPPPDDSVFRERRRCYRLNASGRIALHEETRRLKSALAQARSKGILGEVKAART